MYLMELIKGKVTAAVTTCRRNPDLVQRALRGVLSQTYKDVQILVINDAPEESVLSAELSDRIRELESQYPGRSVTYHLMDHNSGACRARNEALRLAEGEFIAFLDDDDEWLPDKIALQVKAIRTDDRIGIVYCNAYNCYDGTGEEKLRFEKEPIQGDALSAMLQRNIIGSCSFPLIRTSLLSASGGFREDLPALQDWELYLRLLKACTTAYVASPAARLHFHEGERISSHPENRAKAYGIIREEFQHELRIHPESRAGFARMGITFYCSAGMTDEAGKCLREAIRYNPLAIHRNIRDLRKVSHVCKYHRC